MSAVTTKKPRMSLEKYLTKQYEALWTKYKKLATAMGECDVFDIYQFRKGIERVAKQEIGKTISEAYAFWGQIDADKEAHRLHITAWYFQKKIEEEAHRAHTACQVKYYRANFGPKNPLPHYAPVEVLGLSEEVLSSFYFKDARTVHDITFRSEDFFRREYKEEQVEHIKQRLAAYGRTIDTF